MGEALSGADAHRIYLDAIEEALHQPRPVGRPRQAERGRRRGADIAKRQLALVERQQRRLEKSLRPPDSQRCQECARRLEVTAKDMPAIAEASESITKQIVALVASLRDAAKAERERMASLDEQQLLAVLRKQILRCELSDLEWAAVLTEKFGEPVAELLMRGEP